MYACWKIMSFLQADLEDGVHPTIADCPDGECNTTSGGNIESNIGDSFSIDWIQRFQQLSISNSQFGGTDRRVRIKLGAIAAIIARGFSQLSIGRHQRFIADIIREATPSTCNDLLEQLKKQKNTQALIAIWHPENTEETKGHIHCYHICSYNQSHCRCVFLRGFNIKKRDPRRTPYIGAHFTTIFWRNFINYYLRSPRKPIYFKIASRDYISKINQIRNMESSRKVVGEGSESMVEGSDLSCQDLDWEHRFRSRTVQQNIEHVNAVKESLDTGYSNIPGLQLLPDKSITRKINIQNQLVTAIEELLVIPVESSCQVKLWLEHPTLCLFNQADSDYIRACNLVNRRIQFLTYLDLKKLHLNKPHALYLAREPNHYYNPEESMFYIEQLLDFQFPDYNDKLEFLTTLYNVCEKNVPKLNSIYLWGPANCGKSWFMDMVTSFYINVGHVKNFVRGQNFPLNDCVARRILLWNEPSIMPSAFDSVKMIAGGDPCPCAVKYQGDGKITRTPLIFTSNKETFGRSSVWTTRIKTYHWNPAIILKEATKYPHPYTYALLIDKYILNE